MCGKPTLIVGAGEIGHRLEHYLERLPEAGMIPVGFVDDDCRSRPTNASARRAPVLGTLAEFDAVVGETGTRHVLFAFGFERRTSPCAGSSAAARSAG